MNRGARVIASVLSAAALVAGAAIAQVATSQRAESLVVGGRRAGCDACLRQSSLDCPACLGSGKFRVSCAKCKGKGRVECAFCKGGGHGDRIRGLFDPTKPGRIDCTNPVCVKGQVTWGSRPNFVGKVSSRTEDPCGVCGARGSWDCPECEGGLAPCLEWLDRKTVERCCVDCAGTGKLPCLFCQAAAAAHPADHGDGRQAVTCPNCRGAGTASAKCPKCRGSARTTCTSCKGAKRERCNRCGGTGNNRYADQYGSRAGVERCTLCRSTGHRPCDACDETGKERCPNCDQGSTKKPCTFCEGSGKIACATCADGAWRHDELYGCAYAKGGRHAEALECFERALSTAPARAPGPRRVDRDTDARARLSLRVEAAKQRRPQAPMPGR